MAYKLETQRIIPGGLNLLAPGDQVAEGDCLDLADFWSGAAGRLEQAPTEVLVSNPTISGSRHSICQADGRIYYGGVDGTLRQIGRALDASIDGGYDTTPLGMLSYQGFVWVMNRSKQRKDDGTTVSDWTPAAPGIPTLTDGGVDGSALIPAVGNPPEVGGLLAQEYSYYVTWQLGTLGETNPSTVTGVITPATITPAVDGSIVRVTQPTAPAAATGWNIYRKGPLLITPYRLNEGTIDITRTYVDDYGDAVHTHSDDDLLSLGIVMEGNHDPAPACRVMANQVYNGRMVVANSAANPNRLWYTPALQPGFFRGAGNPNGGDWVDIGTDKGDEVLAIIVHPGQAIIYRSKSIWRQIGDFGDINGRLDCIVPDMGTVGVRGVVSTSLGDYFVWNDGVYKFNNDWAGKLSQKVEPVFLGKSTTLVKMGTAFRSKCAIGHHNGRLWVSYPNIFGEQGASLIYHIDTQRWFDSGLSCFAFLDTSAGFLGATDGIFSLESTYKLTPLIFQSEFQDCGLPDHEKTWADLVLNHNTQGQPFQVIIRLNKGSSAPNSFTVATINSSGLTKEVIPLIYPADYSIVALRGKPIRSFNLSVRLTGSGGASAVTFDSPLLLHYYVEARKGRRFDTSLTDHGTPDAKTVDQVEIDIDTSDGLANLQVSSDIPGGTSVVRTTAGGNITASTGREAKRLVFPIPVDGKLLRYEITTATGMQVYGMRVRVLPIGVYLDGSVGDFWQPQPLGIGV